MQLIKLISTPACQTAYKLTALYVTTVGLKAENASLSDSGNTKCICSFLYQEVMLTVKKQLE